MLPKSLRPLFPYMKKYRGSFAVGGLCVLLLNGIWVLLPQIIRAPLMTCKQASPGENC